MSPRFVSQLSLRLRNSSTSQDLFASAGGVLAAAVAVSSWWFTSSPNEQAENKDTVPSLRLHRAKFPFHNNLLTTSHFTFCEAMNSSSSSHYQSEMNENVDSNQIIMECDYVVVGGHGKAGQSAVRTLQKLDPNANIVIIDPNSDYNNNHYQNTTIKSRGNTKHLQTHASYIDHSNKLIRLHANPSPTAHDVTNCNTTNPVVRFRKSALIATGSRGAPPPNECINSDARERVLELRSTSIPPKQSMLVQQQRKGSIPILDPSTVRSLSLLAASQSATVAVMGSGFDALELAASLSRIQQQHSNKNGNSSDGNSNKKVILLFGSSGPMSTRLPRYLSAAVSKRLRNCGIDVEDRSMIRYLSMESSSSAAGAVPRLALYTEKSYDHLDSRRMTTDLLVLASNTDGNNGTSVIPTTSSNTQTSYNQNQLQQQYLPWSSLISPPLLTCYIDDGRVVTNSEYQAASNIYAAGSVTRSPNPRNGRADVAGGYSVCSARVGEIAARNMVLSGSRRGSTSDGYDASTDNSIPVWRSDVVPYLRRTNGDSPDEVIEQSSDSVASDEANTLALYSMGIHALCVGRCDSETLATHGFWWTNTNQQSSNNDDRINNSSSSSSSSSSSRERRMNTLGPNAFMRRITKKSTSTFNPNGNKTRGGSGSLPVYGSGVVYYLDRTGSICGIMLWGLPFSKTPRDCKSGMNHLIVERMKEVISSNGGVAIQEHSNKIANEHVGLNDDLNLLSYLHLVEESKLLASMALSGSKPKDDVTSRVTGKPLHRYTPIKSHELSSLGKLRRREMGYIAEEDDLFYPVVTTSSTSEEGSTRPPSLKRIYPMHGGAITTNVEKEMELRQLQIDRSRPPKEEPLWMRKGEEQKYVNYREAMDQSFYRNIQQGKFSDGTDAVKQAPVPQAYLEAKEQLKSWSGALSREEESGPD